MEKGFTRKDLLSGATKTYQVLKPMYDLIDLSDIKTCERTMEHRFCVRCNWSSPWIRI